VIPDAAYFSVHRGFNVNKCNFARAEKINNSSLGVICTIYLVVDINANDTFRALELFVGCSIS
jgi:hypothetical protein